MRGIVPLKRADFNKRLNPVSSTGDKPLMAFRAFDTVGVNTPHSLNRHRIPALRADVRFEGR